MTKRIRRRELTGGEKSVRCSGQIEIGKRVVTFDGVTTTESTVFVIKAVV
jgi:hypothetical protein